MIHTMICITIYVRTYKMKSELITTVSHQVHNKLNVIETENALACNNNNNTNNNNNSESTSSNTTCVNNEQTNQIGIKSPLDAVAAQNSHSIIQQQQQGQQQQQQQQQDQLQQQNKIYLDREIDTITKSISSSHLEIASEILTPIPQLQQIPIKKDTVTVVTAASVVATPTADPKPPSSFQDLNKRKETMEAKRERKAARTLTIITSAFVICWLPFFMMALLLPLFDIYISDVISSIFLWLGYFNSTINPIIYTIFSPEFRSAFQRILFGSSHKTSHYRRKL